MTTASLPLLRELLLAHTNAEDEAQILQLVRDLPADDLRVLLTEDAERLFSTVDDRLLGPDNRRALVELLAVDRRADLDLDGVAAVVNAVQIGRTTSQDEQVVADLLCSVRGPELTHLKNILNLRRDRRDLEGLVFLDIDDDAVRDRILAHFRDEAAQREVSEAKILSDIDDTVFCKIHDKRYPKGTLYPGVLAFQEALDRGPDDDPLSIGDITFVTARPGDFLGIVKGHSRESLQKAGIADLSILSGSLFALRTLDAMAGKKVENVDHYAQLYPEYRMTFMGDSGQGDVLVGERLWELHGPVMDAVFIHDVVDTPPERREELATRRIWFHDTYVGAATKALELGLISQRGHDEVVHQALEGLSAIDWDDSAQEAHVRELFDRDVAAAATGR